MNHDPRYKELRRQITGYLVSAGAKHGPTVTRKLVLPDLEPEDLSVPRAMFAARRGPIRRREIKRESVEIE
jgi:nitrate/nitrite transport system ATP-binding protein